MLVYGCSKENMLWVAVCRKVRGTLDGWFPYAVHKGWEPFKDTASQTLVLSAVANKPVCRRHCVKYQVYSHPLPHFRFQSKVFNAGKGPLIILKRDWLILSAYFRSQLPLA